MYPLYASVITSIQELLRELVHGGLRYLKQAQIKVVAETGKERAIVYENGPHVMLVVNLPNVPPLCIGNNIHSGVVTWGPFS
jgi:hypothetical protein